ncbi:sensor histidine kinase [Halovenus sp. HT40]|uniref:sensor histidine kinase n=1 Tax=Halovenus sp. HT40 TaxID=3126691 RepID=UPI00300F63A1
MAGLTAGVALWVRRVGRGPPATVFIWVLTVNAVWMLAAGASVLVNSIGPLAFALTVRGITSAVSGLLFFVFALYYTGRDDLLTTPVRVAIGLLGAVFVLAPTTNPWTGLTARNIEYISEPITHADVTFGPLSLPIFAVSTLLTLSGLGLIGNLFIRSRRATRAQAGLLLGAVTVPVALTTGQILDLFPYPMLPYAPAGAGVLSISIGVAMFQNQLFVAEPVARSSVVEQISDPILVVGGHQELIDYNLAADDVFSPLTIGDPLSEQCPELYQQAEPEQDSTDRALRSEITVRPGQEEHIYSVESSALDVGSGQRAEALVFREITDRKQYEQQLEQIASTISHDLRNPLSVATGNVELAAETGDVERLDTARNSLERMDRIITDVLELSREGTRVMNREEIVVDELVEKAWETTETTAAELVIETNGEGIDADPERLQRLFENLFRNAVEHGSTNPDSHTRQDAIEHGGEDVTVWVGFDDGMFVEDNGPGIPAENRDAVFEHGYTDSDGNTGFGLDIVESIATAHGWSVSVEEGREGGAKFVFGGVETLSRPTTKN